MRRFCFSRGGGTRRAGTSSSGIVFVWWDWSGDVEGDWTSRTHQSCLEQVNYHAVYPSVSNDLSSTCFNT